MAKERATNPCYGCANATKRQFLRKPEVSNCEGPVSIAQLGLVATEGAQMQIVSFDVCGREVTPEQLEASNKLRQEVEAAYQEQIAIEGARWANMTPAERQAELDKPIAFYS